MRFKNQFPANFRRPFLGLLTNSSDSHTILVLILDTGFSLRFLKISIRIFLSDPHSPIFLKRFFNKMNRNFLKENRNESHTLKKLRNRRILNPILNSDTTDFNVQTTEKDN
ncbi:hypothetical protein BpHYR1_012218 [Brachionus plicatilis]|uniref:Uncharacterized protein n=1 Tax=Brachionus plicatilis TaxID=10195 RepID=A0A3M7P1Y4_BRAPC|nr:hypothetical protein BpHYR1_012218 [Brachionus plicatilis]